MLTFARSGDLYMPGEQEYVDQAKRDGLVSDEVTAAYFVAVVLVPKGNPKNIRSLADLARSDVRVGIGNPDSVACGLVARKILQKAGVWDEVYANVRQQGACTATAMELSNALVLGAVDAVVNWDAVGFAVRDKVDILAIPAEQNVQVPIPLGTLVWSEHKQEAARFVQFILSEEGRRHFTEHGYHTDLNHALAYYGDLVLE
jgi:molybdate transport system substrate-binding protein